MNGLVFGKLHYMVPLYSLTTEANLNKLHKVIMTAAIGKLLLQEKYQLYIKQVAGAGFGGQLLICLIKFTLNKKSLAHLLQFRTKYQVYSDSLRVQITEHTEYNYVTAALYCVGEELENLMRTYRQRTNRQRIQLQRPL